MQSPHQILEAGIVFISIEIMVDDIEPTLTDLYHAVNILVIFPVSITVMNASIRCTNLAPDYYFVQPQVWLQ